MLSWMRRAFQPAGVPLLLFFTHTIRHHRSGPSLSNDKTSGPSLHSLYCSSEVGRSCWSGVGGGRRFSSGAFVLVPLFHHKHAPSYKRAYNSQGKCRQIAPVNEPWLHKISRLCHPVIKLNDISPGSKESKVTVNSEITFTLRGLTASKLTNVTH